jgi:hypothetical protein
MPKKIRATQDKKTKRKELMAKILHKISDAMKEYATPASERKIAKRLKKTSKKLSDIVATDK